MSLNNIIKIGLVVFMSTVFVTLSQINIKAHAAGYITRTVTANNSIGSVQTNYPVEVVVNTATEITANKMRSDCGDIRIYQSNFATLLNYAIIKCNTTYTSVIFTVPTLSTGSSTYYMTYGDSSLTTTATPSSVFDIYEMFSSTTPTCTLAGSATWDSANQWLQLTPNTTSQLGTCNYSYSPPISSKGYRAYFDIWTGGTTTGREASWQYAYDASVPISEDLATNGGHYTFDEFEDRVCYTRATTGAGGADKCYLTTTLDNSTWTSIKTSWDTNTQRIFIDGTERVTNTSTPAPTITNTNFGFGARTSTVANEHRIRNFAVKRHSEFITASLTTGARPANDTISFAIRNSADTANFANLCDFGNLISTSTGSCQYRLKVSTAARNGYSLQVKTSGDFVSSSVNITNAAAGSGGSGGTLVTAGSEVYGVTITPGSCTNGTMSLANAFNPSAGNSVLFNYATATTVATCNGPNVPVTTDLTNTTLVDQKISISGNTPAGNYTQTATWTAIPNY